MPEEENCGCSQESSPRKVVDRLAGKSNGSRSWAASGPLIVTGTAGAGVGTNGERVQWGPEQGTCFFAGASGNDGAEIGSFFSGGRETTTCSPQPACAVDGANRTPAKDMMMTPSVSREQVLFEGTLMVVGDFWLIRIYYRRSAKTNSSKVRISLQGRSAFRHRCDAISGASYGGHSREVPIMKQELVEVLQDTGVRTHVLRTDTPAGAGGFLSLGVGCRNHRRQNPLVRSAGWLRPGQPASTRPSPTGRSQRPAHARIGLHADRYVFQFARPSLLRTLASGRLRHGSAIYRSVVLLRCRTE